MRGVLPLVFIVFIAVSCRPGYDVVVFGSTPAGIAASRAAAMSGERVALVSATENIGGVMSGGLGYTDVGNKKAIEGFSKFFFRQIGKEYGKFEQYIFEPHIASQVFEEMINIPGIEVLRGCRLEGVSTTGNRIKNIRLSNGKEITIKAKNFIDASYEGDLMAYAGVSYRVGRESRDTYGEEPAGVTIAARMMQFPDGVDPYVIKGDSTSGFLPGIEGVCLSEMGRGDSLTQAYCYRVFLTRDKQNRIPFSRPEKYDSTRYELALRLIEKNPGCRLRDLFIMRGMPGNKVEFNNRGGFSTDFVGANYDYPEASSQRRAEIEYEHKMFTQGLFYFYASDPGVPEHIRREMAEWGYCRDEFGSDDNFTRQLYIRESRRMIGERVATMFDCQGKGEVHDMIGYGSYGMDCHSVRRVAVCDENGNYMVKNEGGVGLPVEKPYPISYSWIVPKREECVNLIVPVCLSASHLAYSSLRTEPTFMVMGHVAGLAAAISAKKGEPVQDVNASEIRRILETDPYMDGTSPDIIIDNDDAEYFGKWNEIVSRTSFGPTCLEHTGPFESDSVLYHIPDGVDGEYIIRAYVQKFSDTNTYTKRLPKDLCHTQKWVVSIGDVKSEKIFDSDSFNVLGQTAGDWVELGKFKFEKSKNASVRFRPTSEGRVRTDAIMLIKSN